MNAGVVRPLMQQSSHKLNLLNLEWLFVEATWAYQLDQVLKSRRHILWPVCNEVRKLLADGLYVGETPCWYDADGTPTAVDVEGYTSHRIYGGLIMSADKGIRGHPFRETSCCVCESVCTIRILSEIIMQAFLCVMSLSETLIGISARKVHCLADLGATDRSGPWNPSYFTRSSRVYTQ